MRILTILLILSLFSCQKQDQVQTLQTTNKQSLNVSTDKKILYNQIQLDIEHYYDSYNNARWDDVIDMMYQKAWGNKTRNEVVADFAKMTSMGIDRNVYVKRIEKISKVVEHNGTKYCKVYLGSDVKVYVKDMMLERKDFMQRELELSYDTNDVAFNEEENFFYLDAYHYLIAISEKGTNAWSYLEVDKQKEPLLEQFFEEEVWSQLD